MEVVNKGKKSNVNPWKRKMRSDYDTDDEEIQIYSGRGSKAPSTGLDVYTKRAVLNTAPSVVALLSYTGDKQLSEGCGTIIEADNDNNITVITSANLVRRPTTGDIVLNHLADNLKVDVVVAEGKVYKGEIVVYDFHYNILVLRFQSSFPHSAARLGHINDSLSLSVTEEKPFELRPHSVKLIPGDSVVALGRKLISGDSVGSFRVVAFDGIFCVDQCLLDCKELCLATCGITRCVEGGPLINLAGDVIGITYYDMSYAIPFLPINVVLKWWESYKIHGKCYHPFLGFDATNLYAVDLLTLERSLKRFPNICKGVMVEKVKRGSIAHSSGLLKGDIIVQCGDRKLQSFLEMVEMMWEKVGESVQLVVARENEDALIHLNFTVAEAQPHILYRWPRWPHRIY